MRAPSRAARSAIASPMPRDAPVMSSVLSFRVRSVAMAAPRGLQVSSRRRGITCRAMWLAECLGHRAVHRLAGMEAVAGHGVAVQVHIVELERRHVAATRGTFARPVAQRAVVALRVGAGHPAQRLRQRRKLMDRRQRAEHHVLHAGAVAQQIGDRFARPHRAQRADLVDDSLTPVTTIARSITGSSLSRSNCSVCAVVRPGAREQPPLQRARPLGRANSGSRLAAQRVVLRRHADAGRR